jgi:hypothetical protein
MNKAFHFYFFEVKGFIITLARPTISLIIGMSGLRHQTNNIVQYLANKSNMAKILNHQIFQRSTCRNTIIIEIINSQYCH